MAVAAKSAMASTSAKRTNVQNGSAGRGELCIDRHGFDPDPDCAANAPDPSQCPDKVVDEHKCRYGSFNGCIEASTRTWQSCKGSPDDCEKSRFDEDEFCKSLSGRPGAKSPAL
jgi:hypothetical protein